MNRAYSTLVLKAVDDEAREITGIASTPNTDRQGDVVVPKGATFKLPIPLLWQHDHGQPIGEVYAAKVTDKGIEIKARLVKVDAPALLAARLEEAWQSIKTGLVRGLSIGFSPLKYAFMDNGGIEFSEWNWHELSAVTIPANMEATIQTIKSLDKGAPAATGQPLPRAVKLDPPAGASAVQIKSLTPLEGQKMNIAEQIKGFKASRQEKAQRMGAIMELAAKTGRTLDAAESEEHDTLVDEVKSIDTHVKRLEDLQALQLDTLTPVENATTAKAATEVRGGNAVAKVREDLAPGIEFARYVMCLGSAKGDLATASAIAQKRFPHSERINLTLKAAVSAGTTTDPTWASPLVEYNQFAGDFIEFLRPQTILGKFGQGGVPALRAIPFNVHIRGQSSGGSGYWVGQGAPKPLTKFDFNDAYLGWAKVANIAVLTEELMRFSNPSAEALVRDALAGALIERLDTDFIDPSKAAVSNVSPASITNGVTPITSSGDTADNVRADIAALWATADSTDLPTDGAVYITDSRTARRLSMLRNALGQVEFPGVTMRGGTLDGIPLLISNYVPSDSSGSLFVLAFASEIWLADDGLVTIDASREASLQMLDNPTNNSASGTPTSMVSMFQTNSVALRAERYINWAKRRTQAVAYLDGVNWGA